MEGNALDKRTSGRELVWRTTTDGCRVPVSHPLNADGYFRKKINGRKTFVHVWVYEQAHGPVPPGKEVHHKCRNRACCTDAHLELKERGHHVGQHNTARAVALLRRARKYWLRMGCTGAALAVVFGVSRRTGFRWTARWKSDPANL